MLGNGVYSMRQDIVIIGGGPAGMAAAVAAYDKGISDILVLERDDRLGGILNQCIHNGFGLHTFKEELTGPEYAQRYVDKVTEKNIPYKLNTIVIDISPAKDSPEQSLEPGKIPLESGYLITAMNKDDGLFVIEAKAVILAMGCRERARGALNIPGYRPAGIYSAGTAQRYVNIEGKMPGKEVVILGSGDIGLIMARRMTLEGAKVKLVAELMPYSGGLKRNIVQCLDDFNIPLKLSHTVVDIGGKERVESVTIAKVDENRKPIKGTEEVVPCDTLLLSCGLIPENELSSGAGIKMHPVTGGPVVNESLETNRKGIYACGNVLHVHDLVDYVSKEASAAGENAAKYVLGLAGEEEGSIQIQTGKGVRYTVPSTICLSRMEELQTVRFRVADVYKNCAIFVSADGAELMKLKKQIVAPGEMEQVILKKQLLMDKGISKEIRIELITEQEG